jgi:tRNA-2-methylthio-N6-dimethylallyladenosine synthase
VEGYNHATGQWIGRTTQNRTLNFVHPHFASPSEATTLAGTSWNVRVTRAGPNSLAGEVVI